MTILCRRELNSIQLVAISLSAFTRLPLREFAPQWLFRLCSPHHDLVLRVEHRSAFIDVQIGETQAGEAGRSFDRAKNIQGRKGLTLAPPLSGQAFAARVS